MKFLSFQLQINRQHADRRRELLKTAERTRQSLVTLLLSYRHPEPQLSDVQKPTLRGRRRRAKSGFTLIELAIAIAVIGVLTAFAVMSFGSKQEYRDAAAVQAAQGSLQSIVSQGAIRMDQRPDALDPNAVLTAFKTVLGQNGATSTGSISASVSGGAYLVTIKQGGNTRTATFTVATNGDIQLTSLSGFTTYTVDKTRTPWTIKKGT